MRNSCSDAIGEELAASAPRSPHAPRTASPPRKATCSSRWRAARPRSRVRRHGRVVSKSRTQWRQLGQPLPARWSSRCTQSTKAELHAPRCRDEPPTSDRPRDADDELEDHKPMQRAIDFAGGQTDQYRYRLARHDDAGLISRIQGQTRAQPAIEGGRRVDVVEPLLGTSVPAMRSRLASSRIKSERGEVPGPHQASASSSSATRACRAPQPKPSAVRRNQPRCDADSATAPVFRFRRWR